MFPWNFAVVAVWLIKRVRGGGGRTTMVTQGIITISDSTRLLTFRENWKYNHAVHHVTNVLHLLFNKTITTLCDWSCWCWYSLHICSLSFDHISVFSIVSLISTKGSRLHLHLSVRILASLFSKTSDKCIGQQDSEERHYSWYYKTRN